MTRREPLACSIDADLPGCDTGPAGRLGFVLREARAAWRRRTSAATTRSVDRTPSADRTDPIQEGTR